MAKCGVKEYDSLPARVGTIDVDALRAEYHVLRNKLDGIIIFLDTACDIQRRKNG